MVVNHEIKTALSLKIAGILRQEIYENALKVGQHLNESVLALRFGISRGPIRDALSILENEGLINSLPNGRKIVQGFSSKEINDYYNLRYYIESESMRCIFSEPEDDLYYLWLNDLEDLLKESKSYLAKTNKENLFNITDFHFHLSIVTKANKKIFIQVWKTLANMSLTIMEMNKRYLADKYFHEIKSTFELHDKIFISIKNRNLDAALENLNIHFKKGSETFSRLIDTLKNSKET